MDLMATQDLSYRPTIKPGDRVRAMLPNSGLSAMVYTVESIDYEEGSALLRKPKLPGTDGELAGVYWICNLVRL
jgi:hypothetical protein